MQVSNTNAGLNIYQEAKRSRRGFNIDSVALMHYCEGHNSSREMRTVGSEEHIIYTMEDGFTVWIMGPIPNITDRFIPTRWSIQRPKVSIMESIRDALSIFKRQ